MSLVWGVRCWTAQDIRYLYQNGMNYAGVHYPRHDAYKVFYTGYTLNCNINFMNNNYTSSLLNMKQ